MQGLPHPSGERYTYSRVAIGLRVARECCKGDAAHPANGLRQIAEIIIPADARRVIASGRERSFEHGDDVSLRHPAAKRYQVARALSRATSPSRFLRNEAGVGVVHLAKDAADEVVGGPAAAAFIHQPRKQILRQQAVVLGEHGDDALQDEPAGADVALTARDQGVECLGDILRRFAGAPSAGGSDPALADHLVLLPQHDDLRFPGLGLGGVHLGEALDGEPVARFAQPRRRAVEDDLPGAGFGRNGVGLEPLAVGHVAAQDAFVGQHANLVHEVPGDARLPSFSTSPPVTCARCIFDFNT